MSESLAFVFPGQGSQAVGMLADVAEKFPQVKATFDEASAVLGTDLWQLTQEGPAEELNRTDMTQPALLTASVALWRVWNEQGGAKPAYMSGHSLGEYSALVCAGAIAFEDAVKLVNKRGLFMQSAVPAGEGAMAAIIGLDDAAIESACEQAAQGEVVSAVNYNSPGQVVIAGQTDAVNRASELCKEAGAKRALPLPVSVPSHCALMKPAAEQLAAELEAITVNTPDIPVLQNVTAEVTMDATAIKDNLVQQLYRPVLWVDCVNNMAGKGVERMLECGPGKVLSGLNKRISRGLAVATVADVELLANPE
ncbi:Malonyl CoA-acyl carrier protein transacylase [gamma proteobacterium IMCC2047]|nr:Malonyl CoA-acyl carrier protein transacylase [gamma proteobacterium IMCC2047]